VRHCPNCLGRLRIADALLGRRVRCPLCQTAFFGERESFAETQAILDRLERRLSAQHADLQRREQQARGRLDAVLAFDGNWSNPLPDDVPLFRPLAERQAPIIAIANLKGGVGKTTLTANLGATLWNDEAKRRVLLLDLDYQANLTMTCLDRKTIARLRQQERLVETLFADGPPDPRAVTRCAEPVFDDRGHVTEGSILAADERLGIAETHALNRWLIAPERGDVRFRLRRLLHAEAVQRDYHYILLDCPPRLTTTCINALTAADFVLIPVVLDEKSTESAPRLLRWLRERRETLFAGISGVGVVANKTRGLTRDRLVNRERDEWDALAIACRDAWHGDLAGFDTVVPFFTEAAMARKFPACHRELGPTFVALADELRTQVNPSVEVQP
jgi:cellulose biosynthesis protein BcsQ